MSHFMDASGSDIWSIQDFRHYAQGSAADGRSAPSLVAHVIVALSQDRHSVLCRRTSLLDMATKLPFYIKMFADAGFPLNPGQTSYLIIL